MDEMIKNWFMKLYKNEIEEVKSIIDNEKLWEKGHCRQEPNPHTENIIKLKEYMAVLLAKLEEVAGGAEDLEKYEEKASKDVMLPSRVGVSSKTINNETEFCNYCKNMMKNGKINKEEYDAMTTYICGIFDALSNFAIQEEDLA